MSFPWTDEQGERAIEMYYANASMREIAAALGCSRNAAIGKIHRLQKARKLCLRGEPGAREPTRIQLGKRMKAMTTPTLSESAGFILPAPRPKPQKPCEGRLASIVEVTGCRWPTGEDDGVPGGHTFCNCARRDGSSYCAEHSKARVAKGSRETIRQTIRSSLHLVRKARAA